eukprot:scaffold277806_cov27-Tisochrysis_lutea.AAC.1
MTADELMDSGGAKAFGRLACVRPLVRSLEVGVRGVPVAPTGDAACDPLRASLALSACKEPRLAPVPRAVCAGILRSRKTGWPLCWCLGTISQTREMAMVSFCRSNSSAGEKSASSSVAGRQPSGSASRASATAASQISSRPAI